MMHEHWHGARQHDLPAPTPRQVENPEEGQRRIDRHDGKTAAVPSPEWYDVDEAGQLGYSTSVGRA